MLFGRLCDLKCELRPPLIKPATFPGDGMLLEGSVIPYLNASYIDQASHFASRGETLHTPRAGTQRCGCWRRSWTLQPCGRAGPGTRKRRAPQGRAPSTAVRGRAASTRPCRLAGRPTELRGRRCGWSVTASHLRCLDDDSPRHSRHSSLQFTFLLCRPGRCLQHS